ncbi:MAG: glycosyltransferase [Lachnospiraceae bacterium]|nr:glycosyltransferase [Lachnospiraceae bacterium]
MGRIFRWSNFKKTVRYLRRNGIRQAYYAARERMDAEHREYYVYEEPPGEELSRQRELGKEFTCRFSILVPLYETEETYLRAMVESVLSQTYGNFELILADASSSGRVEEIIRTYEDKRILYRRLKSNCGISGNTNQALMYATGDYAALLDHDDILTPDALFEMASRIEQEWRADGELKLLYSDEDKCSGDGTAFFEVNRKPDFNLDLLLSNNYICHFLVMKRQLMQELQLRGVCDGAQDFDLVLRCVGRLLGREKRPKRAEKLPVAHVKKVLYHWRCHEASTAENPQSKAYAYDAGKRAVEDFLRSRQWKGRVSHMRHLGFYRVDYQPGLLQNRTDVVLVGGRLLDRKNRIAGGIYTSQGEALYLGLHREYSGYMHRACLQQEAEMIDVRCMVASKEAEKILEEMTGLPYLKNPGNGRFNWRDGLKKDADYVGISRRLCERAGELGMRIVWDPSLTEKI